MNVSSVQHHAENIDVDNTGTVERQPLIVNFNPPAMLELSTHPKSCQLAVYFFTGKFSVLQKVFVFVFVLCVQKMNYCGSL
jgi:hypothetical protein